MAADFEPAWVVFGQRMPVKHPPKPPRNPFPQVRR